MALARWSGAKRKAPQDAGTSNEDVAAFEGKGSNHKWKSKGKDVAAAKTLLTYESIKNSHVQFIPFLAK